MGSDELPSSAWATAPRRWSRGEYYKDADPAPRCPGLMHVKFGDYHVHDVEFVAAFDVDCEEGRSDLSEAIVASENNTIKICDVPPLT